MFVPSKAISRSLRALLLCTAAAGGLNLALGASAHAGSSPVATNPGNWSHASATTSGSTETVTVTSSRAYGEWSSFNLSAGNTLNVVGQTGANWILVNRVVGGTGSTISGNINAAGQVWIIDPNGVTVNAGAALNVGGLLLSSASWSAIDRSNFLAGGTSWNFNDQNGPVVMNGTVVTNGGGVVALLAPSVTVGGTVTAGSNTQFLAVAAHTFSLGFTDNGTYFTLSGLTIVEGDDGDGVTFNNGSSISAGRIVVAAAGATSAASIVVGGSLTANAVRSDGADIVLMADGTGPGSSPTNQTVLTGGAVAPVASGSSRSTITLASSGSLMASGVTLASVGDIDLTGNVSATNAKLTSAEGAIDQTAGIVSATSLTGSSSGATSLAGANAIGTVSNFTSGGNFSLSSAQSLTAGAVTSTGGNLSLKTTAGDLTVTGALATGAGDTLTLDSFHSIFIGTNLTVPGAGQVAIVTNDGGSGGDYSFGLTSQGFTGSLTFTGGAGSGAGLTINGNAYSLLYSLADFQAINNRFGYFALANSLDGTGQTYTDSVLKKLSGTLTGLGHTLNNFTVTSTTPGGNVGPVGTNAGTLRDIGVVGGSVTSNAGNDGGFVGGLVGDNANDATVSQSYATDQVTGSSGSSGGAEVGGLVGANFFDSTISHSFATGSVSVNGDDGSAGGLVGVNNGSAIIQSYATGRATATGSGVNAGGLAGENIFNGSIEQSYATGSVSATGTVSDAGGLVGANIFGATIDQGFATGDVASSGTAATAGGLVGLLGTGTSVTNSYYDYLTTGRAAGAQTDGSTGLSTTALQGALPTGFFSSVWATGSGLYPYLNWQYATTPQAITGTAISVYPTTPLAGASVNIYMNGSDIAATTVGANGYYYALVAGNTIKYNTPFGTTLSLPGDSGVDAITYSDTHVASATAVAVGNTILGRNEVGVSQPTLSALFAGMGAAFGPTEMAYLKTTAAFSFQDLYSYDPTFTIDQAVDVTNVFKVTEINHTGAIIDAAPITVEPGATLMLTANGALQIDAPISVKGSGEVNLHYDYYQTSAGGVANPSDFSFGNGGSLTYLTSGGGVATGNQGGQFVLNNIEYTLIYTMAQLDSIDGINGVTGASEGVYGPGLNGNYALVNTLNAAGTTYSRDLINNFEGTFEGLNNSIDNLTIKDNGATSDSVGLFGALHGTARDIDLVNVSISDNDPNHNPNVGGLAGYSDGNIYNVSVSGDVNATNTLSVNVGGVVGYAPNGTIFNARASDTVEGSAGDVVGGLVGLSYAATISQSWATGNVTSTYATMGGLVGFAQGGTTITQSYATGNVSGGTNSLEGGLVGYNLGTINQTYATGSVTSISNSGMGGLVGSNSGAVILSYWDTDTSGQSRSSGGSGLTTAQLQSGTLPPGFSPSIWSVTPGQNPKLKVAAQ